VEEHAQKALLALADMVECRFNDRILARLWAAEQLRRTMESSIDDLLAEARQNRGQRTRQRLHTWEELGDVLGMSPQGARQRLLRRRTPVDPPPAAGDASQPS
jgi:hypothetical protein